MPIGPLEKCAARIRAHAIAWQRGRNQNRRRWDFVLPAAVVSVGLLMVTFAPDWRSLLGKGRQTPSLRDPSKSTEDVQRGDWRQAFEMEDSREEIFGTWIESTYGDLHLRFQENGQFLVLWNNELVLTGNFNWAEGNRINVRARQERPADKRQTQVTLSFEVLLWRDRWDKRARLVIRSPEDGPMISLASGWSVDSEVMSFPPRLGDSIWLVRKQ